MNFFATTAISAFILMGNVLFATKAEKPGIHWFGAGLTTGLWVAILISQLV